MLRTFRFYRQRFTYVLIYVASLSPQTSCSCMSDVQETVQLSGILVAQQRTLAENHLRIGHLMPHIQA